MSRVVVLGAGIAGHTAASFARKWLTGRETVTVVSPNAEYNWAPSNIWVEVGLMGPAQVTFPLAPVDERHGLECSALAEARPTCLLPSPGLPPRPGLTLDLFHDLGLVRGHDELGSLQDAGHFAFGGVGLGLDLRASKGPDDRGAVRQALLVACAVRRAAPRGLGRQVEDAKARHFAIRVSPALEVPAILAHRHTPSLTGMRGC